MTNEVRNTAERVKTTSIMMVCFVHAAECH
jgi:hypothetical protein